MKKYVVKMVLKSIMHDSQPFPYGTEWVYYIGKGGRIITDGIGISDDALARRATDIAELGYSRKCDAARCHDYTNPERTAWWHGDSEIMEIEL